MSILCTPVLTLSFPKGVVRSLAISPDRRIVAGSSNVWYSLFLGQENVIKLWDSQTGELLHILTGYAQPVSAIVFTLDGALLISGSFDGTIRAWDTHTFQERFSIDQASPTPWTLDGKPLRSSLPKIDSLSLHPNQKWIAVGNVSGGVALWDLYAGDKILSMGGGPHSAFTSIAFSPDGKLLAICDNHVGFSLCDVSTGERIYPQQGQAVFGRVSSSGSRTKWMTSVPNLISIAFSPDGAVLAGGSRKGLITLWDVKTKQEIGKVKGHRKSISSLMFSPDSQFLISASGDCTLKLWDCPSLRNVCTFEGHTHGICAAALSSDGKRLVSSSTDRTICFWKVPMR